MLSIKPSVWAYNITDSWALFEGNIKTARPDAGLLSMLNQTEFAEVETTAAEIHSLLLTAPDIKTGILTVSERLLERFPDIITLVSNETKTAGICVGVLVNKKDKLYTVIVMGMAVLPDATATISKIIREHLK